VTISTAPATVFRYFGGTDLTLESREFIRAEAVLCQLTQNFHEWQLPIESCLREVYGEAGSRRFWEIEFSQPASLAHFVALLTFTLESSEFGNPGRPSSEQQVRDMAIRAALIAAYKADPDNRNIFAGNLSSLGTAQYGHQLRPELKVHVREAAECLLRMPKLIHLVPASLSAFLANQDRTNPPAPPYSDAPDEMICDALRHAYSVGDGPNVNEAYARAMGRLHSQGFYATKARILELADLDEFKNQRGASGVQKRRRTRQR
jgi:hypothetical protein